MKNNLITLNSSYRQARIATAMKQRSERRRATIKDALYTIFFILVLTGTADQVGKHLSQVKLKSPLNLDESITFLALPARASEPTKTITKTVIVDDYRVERLREFLISKSSPLSPYAEEIVAEADEHAIDWTLVVSLSAIESRYGTDMPVGSFNAWGLGGSKFMYFKSWTESIAYVSALLGNSYKINIAQGIKNKYCPASDGCNPQWATIVTKASQEIAKK